MTNPLIFLLYRKIFFDEAFNSFFHSFGKLPTFYKLYQSLQQMLHTPTQGPFQYFYIVGASHKYISKIRGCTSGCTFIGFQKSGCLAPMAPTLKRPLCAASSKVVHFYALTLRTKLLKKGSRQLCFSLFTWQYASFFLEESV